MAFHQTRQGYIYFGGTDGLNLFHPDSLRDNPHPPPVRMTAIAVMGKPLQHDTAIGDLRLLAVPHDHKTLGFEFAALDFTAPELNRYSWRLDGFDRDWSEPSSKHETKYTNLSPGDYTFRVKACNNDGVWSENGIVLFITIQPAWYQRWWFWLLCGLALIGSVVMIVRVRVRAVEVQNRLLEVEVHKRTKELREANSEIKRQLEIQDVQSREIELANTELDATLQSLKSTQSQLVQSERMNAIGMLTAGVMHEINNPNAIAYSAINQTRTKLDEMNVYFLSLLDEESKHSPEVQQFQELSNDALSRLELAADGARRVKTIVANLQGFTKHQENDVLEGDWAQEIRSTIGLFQLQFQTVHLHVNIPETMSIHANFGELNQVLLNLMVNAVQAGADTLRIEAEYSPKQVVMRVADNGKGMTDTTRERIFEPFFSTKGVGNSGLGLSISRHIIERHGGKLWVESEVGKGTTFIVELRSGLA
jgi:signal transduction histidine kinase